VEPYAVVESENASGDFADGSQRLNHCLLQTEVFGPTVSAWIEKARELAGR